MAGYTASGKPRSSMRHAAHTYTCMCGKVCRDNGGWSSQQRSCPSWADDRARRDARQAGNS